MGVDKEDPSLRCYGCKDEQMKENARLSQTLYFYKEDLKGFSKLPS